MSESRSRSVVNNNIYDEDFVFGDEFGSSLKSKIQRQSPKKKSTGEVFSDAWAKTFTSDMDHVIYDEFDLQTVEQIADKQINVSPSDVRARIKAYRADPWIRFLSFIGAPNRFALYPKKKHSVVNEEEISLDTYEKPTLLGVFQQIIGYQPDRPLGLESFVNFLLAITLIKPGIRLGYMALTTLRNLIKLPTQFAATFFADWMDIKSSGSMFWHAVSFLPWAFELIYTAGLSPADSAQRGWVAGQEYANRFFGGSKLAGGILGTVLFFASIATTVAVWVATFGVFAKFAPLDLAAKIGDGMTTTPVVSWITAKLGWISTNIVTPILNGVGLGGLTAAPALLAVETWIMSSALVVFLSPIASRFAQYAEHFWNTFEKKGHYELVSTKPENDNITRIKFPKQVKGDNDNEVKQNNDLKKNGTPSNYGKEGSHKPTQFQTKPKPISSTSNEETNDNNKSRSFSKSTGSK